MNRKKQRLVYIDLLKMLALFAVINSHFIVEYCHDLNIVFPVRNIINGMTGKFGVILFALLAGYSSYASSEKKQFGNYVVERYLFFFFCCLVANVLSYVLNMNHARDISSIGMVLGQGIILGDYYCDTFWFIRDFLIGSIISFLAGKYRMRIVEQIVVSIIFFCIGKPFVAFYLSGGVLNAVLHETSFYQKKSFRIFAMVFFLIFFLFIRKESLLTYIEDMFRASALILLLSQVVFPESSICNDISKFFATRTMAIIIAHNIAFHFLQNNTGLHILIFYLLWFVCVCIMSIIIDYIIRTIFKGFILTLRYVKDAVFCTDSK